MDCHATARGSILGGNGIYTELHVLRKGQQMGVPSLSDLAVEGTLNTNKHSQLGVIAVIQILYQKRNDMMIAIKVIPCMENSSAMLLIIYKPLTCRCIKDINNY